MAKTLAAFKAPFILFDFGFQISVGEGQFLQTGNGFSS
jgi:hypothetical protein